MRALVAILLFVACSKPMVAPPIPPAPSGWYCSPDVHLGCQRTQDACGADCTAAASAFCARDGKCFATDDTCQQYLVETAMSPCTETK